MIGEYGMQALPDFQRLNLRQSVYYLNVGRTFHRARVNYNPKGKIDAPVHYFAAAQSKKTAKDQWKNWCRQPILFYEIPGDHFSIMQQPAVELLAGLFEKIL